MKILVFSDSHGKRQRIEDVLRAHLRVGGLDHVFFLGDGLREALDLAKDYPALPFTAVCGNCDDAFTLRRERMAAGEERLIEIDGFRFLLMHGHRYDVKAEHQYAADHAIEMGADVLLYGHTHRAEDITIDGGRGGHIRMINPGSCGAWLNPSFALLETVGPHLICGFGTYDSAR